MFFGLEVKTSQAQAKPVQLENTLKLSQAVLDPSKNGKKEPVCLMVEYEKKTFILCVLDPSVAWQSPLDLVFEGGSSPKFFIKGSGTVHLTGYQTDDDLDDISMSVSDYDEDISEEDEEVSKPEKRKVPTKNASIKNESGKAPTLSKAKEAPNRLSSVRKVKGAAVAQPADDDDDLSDSDDEDFDVLNPLGSDDDEDDQDEDDSDDDIDMDEEEVDFDEEVSDGEDDDDDDDQ